MSDDYKRGMHDGLKDVELRALRILEKAVNDGDRDGAALNRAKSFIAFLRKMYPDLK